MENRQEIEVKLARIREMMESRNLDGLYLKRQDNFSWLTAGGSNRVGIATEMGACGLLVTGDSQFAVTNNIEAPRMIREEKLEEKGFAVHSDLWHADREVAMVKDLVSGKIGADHGFPDAENLAEAIKPLRYSLTPSEIDRYREVGREAALALEEVAVSIHPGDRECEVMGRLSLNLWSRGMDFSTVMCAADNRISDYRHAIPTDQVIEKRVMIGGNMRKYGLVVCCTRFVNFEPVSKQLARQYRDTVEIDCILMANTVPEKSVQVPFRKGIEAYKSRGWENEFSLHHQGGAIGYMPRDYRVGLSTKEIVQENQAFCWNPSITGTKSEDTILATSSGPEILSGPIVFPKMSVEIEGMSFIRPDILIK